MPLCDTSDDQPDEEYDTIPRGLRWRLQFGKKKTEVHSHYTIIRLGSKSLLKKNCESTEHEALQLVDRHTSIPVPKVLGVYRLREGLHVEFEQCPGRPLDKCWHELSASLRKRAVEDVGRFVDQLRNMKPPKNCVIGSSTFGAAFDRRFGKGRFGPFYGLQSFETFVRRGRPVEDFEEEEVRRSRGKRVKPYAIRFAHANLTPHHILMDESGRISAIIGWESAGWYPEYWEYVKMHSATPKTMSDWLQEMRRVLQRYDEELAIDQALLRHYDSSAYDYPLSVRAPSITESELKREQEEIDLKNTESTSG